MNPFVQITSRQNRNAWTEEDDLLWLLTPEEYEQLPDGVKLTSINGEIKTKGVDYIDQDTRFGMIAWGVRESEVQRLLYEVGMGDIR